VLDFGGFLKLRGNFRQALWDTKPVTYLGTYPVPSQKNYLSTDAWPIWNYDPQQMIRVVSYTNAPQSKLVMNGKPVGEVKGLNDQTGVISWDIPFQTGKLEVIGMDKDGKQTCNYILQSTSRPYAITAQSDVSALKKGKGVA